MEPINTSTNYSGRPCSVFLFGEAYWGWRKARVVHTGSGGHEIFIKYANEGENYFSHIIVIILALISGPRVITYCCFSPPPAQKPSGHLLRVQSVTHISRDDGPPGYWLWHRRAALSTYWNIAIEERVCLADFGRYVFKKEQQNNYRTIWLLFLKLVFAHKPGPEQTMP